MKKEARDIGEFLNEIKWDLYLTRKYDILKKFWYYCLALA